MLRKILAVVAGFVVWSVLWLGGNAAIGALIPGVVNVSGSVSNVGFLLALLALSLLASLAAGYTAAALKAHPGAVWLLALVLLVVGIAVELGSWRLLPVWYHLVFLALIVPLVRFGAGLRKPSH
jgi:hypothetical protein